MKKVNVIFLMIFLVIKIFPQEKSEIKHGVKDFFDTIENYTKDYNRSNKEDLFKLRNYSKEDALFLAKEYYKAKAEDPVGFHKYLQRLNNNFNDYFKKNNNTDELRPAQKIGIIYKIISSRFGSAFTDIIGIPWYLRIHVLDIKAGKFKSSIGIIPKTFLVAEIEEILKGGNFFKERDTIEINFLGNWVANADKSFEKNKNYFVGLREWNCYTEDCPDIALYIFPDNNHGIYTIDNGYLIASKNYFGFDDRLEWVKFRQEFNNRYIIKGGHKK